MAFHRVSMRLKITFLPGNGPTPCHAPLSYNFSMNFEWDAEKAASNFRKHGIPFDEATTVFNDPLFVDFYDPDHSHEEHRYIIIGESKKENLLLVSYAERRDIIRLISARKATRKERKTYEEG